jgi:hypothetical protein
MTALREEKAVQPRSAADVEDAARDEAGLGKPYDGCLGSARLPAGNSFVGPVEDIHTTA